MQAASHKLSSSVCTVLFCLFTLCYFLFFQRDLLAYAQHHLSGGMTTYSVPIGTAVLTSLLLALSFLSSRTISRNFRSLPALHHLPSLLLLAALTDINIVEGDNAGVFGHTWLIALLGIAALAVLGRAFRDVATIPPRRSPLQALSANLFALLLTIGACVSLANTDETDHIRLRMERLAQERRYLAAAQLAERHSVHTPSITMLRAYCLGKAGLLGEKFFNAQVTPGSQSLLPSDECKPLLLPPIDIYQSVGGIPSEGMSARECLRLLNKRGLLKPLGRDYLCLAALLDCDLDAFAGLMRDAQPETLPKHYREALALYRHMHSGPAPDFAQPEMEADYDDFQALMREHPEGSQRYSALRDAYGDTYWFYFFVTSRH